MKITKLCPVENYDILLKNFKYPDPFIMCSISHIENRCNLDPDGSMINENYIVMRDGTNYVSSRMKILNSVTTDVVYNSVFRQNKNNRPSLAYSMPVAISEIKTGSPEIYSKEIAFSSQCYAKTNLQIKDIYITEKLYQESKPLYTLTCLTPLTLDIQDDIVAEYTTKRTSHFNWVEVISIKKLTKGKSVVTKDLHCYTLPNAMYEAVSSIITEASRLEESVLKALLAVDVNFFDRLPYINLTEHNRRHEQIYRCSFDNYIATISKRVKSKLAGSPVVYQYEVEYHTGECKSAMIEKQYVTGNWKVYILYHANVKKGKIFDLKDLSVFQLDKILKINISYQKSDTHMLTFNSSGNTLRKTEFDKKYFDIGDDVTLMDIIKEFKIDPTKISEVDISAIMMRYATTSAEEINKTRKSYYR